MFKLLKYAFRKLNLLPSIYHHFNMMVPSFESLNPENLKALKSSFRVAPMGDYYEFGVYKGFSFWFSMQIAELLGRERMHFYGFDSFDGLPTPKGIDLMHDINGNTFTRGNFCAGLDFVEGMMKKYEVPKQKYTFIKGFFEDTLNEKLFKQYPLEKASVVLIDCDIYESTKTVLDFLPNILQNETVIIFDDWGLTDKNKGQQLAVKEWKRRHKNYILKEFCTFGLVKGFRVHIRT